MPRKAARGDPSKNPCEVQILTRIIVFTGVIWFRQVVKGTEITGMIPPYGSKTRTDEDEIYGELKAA